MAKKQPNRVKDVLFFAFLAISLVLVVLVWVDGLRADAEEGPRYFGESAPLEGDSSWTIPGAAPATRDVHESEGAPGGRSGPHGSQRHGTPTSTPVGWDLDEDI